MTSIDGYQAAGELLRALAAPVRIRIVTELATGPRCVHELVDLLHAPQPLVSQHLRVLRAAGVVRGARRGREIAYSLTDGHIAHIVADAISHAGEARQSPEAPESPEAREARQAHGSREAPAGATATGAHRVGEPG